MDILGPLTLTLGIGITNHTGWVNSYGRHLGIVEIDQPLVRQQQHALKLNLRHVSSVDTESDAGMNSIELHYSITFGQ